MQNKYEVLNVIGRGTYGVVYKCKNKETGETVAIKKFNESQEVDTRIILKRELKILRMIKHENIVEFKEAYRLKDAVNIVFEYVEKTLLEKIEKSRKGLNLNLIKKLIYQLIQSIGYLHNLNIIHRDIKPENVLLDLNDNVKLCDFGFGKFYEEHNLKMTEYVATRWYRAPEVLIGSTNYGPEIDFWAIGCLMAEMIKNEPLFPGDNEFDQLNLITKVLGPLSKEQMQIVNSNEKFKNFSLKSKSESLEKKFEGKICKEGMNLLKGLLHIDPQKRFKLNEILNHPFFEDYKTKILGIKLSNSTPNITNYQGIKSLVELKKSNKELSIGRTTARNEVVVIKRNLKQDNIKKPKKKVFQSPSIDKKSLKKMKDESQLNFNNALKKLGESNFFKKKPTNNIQPLEKKLRFNSNNIVSNFGSEKMKQIMSVYNTKNMKLVKTKSEEKTKKHLNQENILHNNQIDVNINEELSFRNISNDSKTNITDKRSVNNPNRIKTAISHYNFLEPLNFRSFLIKSKEIKSFKKESTNIIGKSII